MIFTSIVILFIKHVIKIRKLLFVLKISKLSIFELGSGRISDNVKYAKSQEKKLVII